MNREKITFEEFAYYVRDRIIDYLPDKYEAYEIILTSTEKLGWGTLTGLMIREPQSMVSPTIYLNGYYDRLQCGEMDMYDVLTDISKQRIECEKMDMSKEEEIVNNLKNNFDWDHVKPLVFIEAVNGNRNRPMLENVPHTKIGDIAGVYRIYISDREDGRATVLLNNDMFKRLGISLAQLHQKAVENTEIAFPVEIYSMRALLKKMGVEEFDSIRISEEPDLPFYMVVNDEAAHGAAALFYADFPDKVEEIFPQGCYILPSSVHELMLVSKDNDVDVLTEMVTSINVAKVSPEEQLSDHVYEYNAKTRSIDLAKNDLVGMRTQRMGMDMKFTM